MQIPKKSKIPKIISGIVVTIALISLGFFLLSSFWFWALFDVFAALLVSVGCGGEWWLHHHPAGRKKNEKDEHYKLGSRFIAMVVLGVTMEIFGLSHTISEGVKLEKNVAEIGTTNAQLVSENLVLRSNVVALETKSRWREITQKQKENFIKSAKNVRKFGIRVRYGTHDAEVQSFGVMIVGMLNSAGFIETNVTPLEQWPPGMNMLYVGGAESGQMPSVHFLNNVQITNAPVEPSSGNEKDYYAMPDGSFIEVNEFRAIIAQTNSFSFLMGDGDVFIELQKTNYELFVPPHSVGHAFVISDPNVTKIWDFLKIRAAFDNIGITAEWTTNTNLAAGTCEIFVNPKN